jgi:hypothetical protein
VNAKDNRQGVTERDRSQARQELGVLRFVPVRSKLVWRPDDDLVAFERERLRWLQPCPERLFRELVTRTVEYSRPDFGRRKRHGSGNVENLEGGGSEAIRAMWKKQIVRTRPLQGR